MHLKHDCEAAVLLSPTSIELIRSMFAINGKVMVQVDPKLLRLKTQCMNFLLVTQGQGSVAVSTEQHSQQQ